jgi:hypothetical protein
MSRLRGLLRRASADKAKALHHGPCRRETRLETALPLPSRNQRRGYRQSERNRGQCQSQFQRGGENIQKNRPIYSNVTRDQINYKFQLEKTAHPRSPHIESVELALCIFAQLSNINHNGLYMFS